MKKLLMSLALLGTFAAMSAKGATTDSYMYWMVDVSSDNSIGPFDSAELYCFYESTGKGTYLGGSTPTASGSQITETVPAIYDTGLAYNIGSLSTEGLSFLVELYNGETFVSQSKMSYADALASGGIYQHLLPSGGATPVTFTSFAVPEPTSGLLMLFGLCGLALKRKRA